MPDRRSVTSPENGKKGGGQRGQRLQTRERAKAVQRHAELTAETVIEQIARGALFDVSRLFYTEPGFELHESDGPTVSEWVVSPSGVPMQITRPEWKKGEVKRRWNVGDLRPIHELTEEERTCIAGIEIVMKNATAGDGQIDRVLKLKLADRAKYVEMAAKYHSLLVEKVDVSVHDIGNRLDRARQVAMERNAKKGGDK